MRLFDGGVKYLYPRAMFDPIILKTLHKEVAPHTEALPEPESWHLAGKDTWGAVFDLGDDTLLKLVSRRGGLGNGEALHHREVEALKLLDGLATDYVRVPRLIAAQALPEGGTEFTPALAGWLRFEALPGTRLSIDKVLTMPARTRDMLGERIGAAIADFNNEASKRAHAANIKLGDTISRSLTLARTYLGNAELHHVADVVAKAWEARLATGPLSFVHGDINPENLVDGGNNGPLGLVNFAQSGWSLSEVEFRHFEPLGTLRDMSFRGWTARRGQSPDLQNYYLASAANALWIIATQGGGSHPREQMRHTGLLRHCLAEAGLVA